MKTYIKLDQHGNPCSAFVVNESEEIQPPECFIVFEGPDSVSCSDIVNTWRFKGGALQDVGFPENPSYRWDVLSESWVDSMELSDYQEKKWAEIKLRRNTVESSTFVWNGHIVDADRGRISGAATGALIAKAANLPYEDVWTLADNSTIPVNGDDVFAMGLALMQHVSSCHARARALRGLIYSATTKEQVQAIAWETAV